MKLVSGGSVWKKRRRGWLAGVRAGKSASKSECKSKSK